MRSVWNSGFSAHRYGKTMCTKALQKQPSEVEQSVAQQWKHCKDQNLS